MLRQDSFPMLRHSVLFVLLWLFGLHALAQSYVIYPIPQQQEVLQRKARLTPEVNIVAEAAIDEATVARAQEVLHACGLKTSVSQSEKKNQTNLLLGINGSRGVADRAASRLGLSRAVFAQPKYDRHLLSLSADAQGRAQVVALGEHTDAVFCALATLEQVLEQGGEQLACVRFYDYADTRSRGIIEGYYGVPYNAEVTKDLFRFMARYKMNTYMYGAKSDPYHTRFWSEPYPTTITPEQQRIGYLTQDMLRDIVGVAHAAKVNFIWAIHPGTAFTNPESTDVIDRIMTKFDNMYGLGVRQFGVFVDDVGVPTDQPSLQLAADRLTNLQQSMDARWNGAGQAPADTVKPLQYVPQLYAYSWVKRDVAEQFFRSLAGTPAKTDIYITGRNVWSVPNTEDLTTVNEWLGRETAWWWNYPCNDNDVTKLFPMDMQTNFCDEKHIQNDARLTPDFHGTGTLISNPMQQGEVSKIALFSIADYAWNHAKFDNLQSWRASLPAVVGDELAPYLQRVAPYLRYYDQDALGQLVADYKASVAQGSPRPEPLLRELREVWQACTQLHRLDDAAHPDRQLFYADARPWLARLEQMLTQTILLLEDNRAHVDAVPCATSRFEILSGLGEDIKLSVQTAEPSAQVLAPFIQWLMEQRTPQTNKQ